MKEPAVKSEMAFQIRRATVEDAEALTKIAIRSKAYWGYSDEFMEAFKPELIVKGEYISNAPVFVVMAKDGVIAGFAGMSGPGLNPELIFLFVDPPYIGKGCGALLWQNTLNEARMHGWKSFEIVSDPNAVNFYLNHGAKYVGDKKFSVIPNRSVPLLRFCFNEGI